VTIPLAGMPFVCTAIGNGALVHHPQAPTVPLNGVLDKFLIWSDKTQLSPLKAVCGNW
jgi:hypothetical protein